MANRTASTTPTSLTTKAHQVTVKVPSSKGRAKALAAIVKPSTTGAGYQAFDIEWPQEYATLCCIGAVKITTNASGSFTIGTTALGAANTTATFYNVANDYGVSIPI